MHNFFRPGKNGNSAGSEVTTAQWRQRLIDADWAYSTQWVPVTQIWVNELSQTMAVIILKTIRNEDNSNFVQAANSQRTHYTLPLWASYGASFLSSLGERYRGISRVHCTYPKDNNSCLKARRRTTLVPRRESRAKGTSSYTYIG